MTKTSVELCSDMIGEKDLEIGGHTAEARETKGRTQYYPFPDLCGESYNKGQREQFFPINFHFCNPVTKTPLNYNLAQVW